MAYTDKEVLEAIRAGNDDEVLKYLYKHVLPRIKKYVVSNSGSEDDAKDIFQDAVLIFYRHVKEGKFRDGNEIAGFIFSVGRNLWINLVRKRNRDVALTDEATHIETDESSSTQLIAREREEFVSKMFSMLGETCRTLLTYSIYHRLSMKEIKEKMGFTSENVAKTKHYKCKQRLIGIVKDNASIKDMLQE
ncbi:sigma-70 family RNA polymerase sigma factor [Fulvivirgaceae bacterium PWU4]|uniref:Sigma-70 family RNA polymerase sigma factor n=1 Tax=Chryseosolibacter histidini TaxID=2782349 RepID=A0AAP2GKD9_9BACT|nr:sigma-70 family RNA polymerase sigma factor [Chryseosolibacter histidini]MBT1699216.1 sigma-70 family RNA polymerase sigma factor [Chryseosolibacter histidini]